VVAIHRCAHSLKSSSLLIGALSFANLCKLVEEHSRLDKNGMKPDDIKTLTFEFRKVENALRLKLIDFEK